MTDARMEMFREQYMTTEEWYTRRWHYIEACILKSYLDGWEQTGNQRFYAFAKDFVDSLFDEKGRIPQIDYSYYNIDQIRMGSVLLTLYQHEQDPKYKEVIDRLYDQLSGYPRTGSGSFWHKSNYPNQVWLDGLYMAQPFYARYIKEHAEEKDYSDIIRQFVNVRQFLYDESDRLFYHAYDESREMFWSDATTGRSPCVWGRAAGWLAMALVDVLEILRDESCDLDPLRNMLQEAVDGMLQFQHESGMWYQVVNRSGEPDNYLETSGTLMMAYAILKGVRLGFLSKRLGDSGKAAFDGTVRTYLTEHDGEIRLGGICRSAGLGRKPETGVVRDGSYEYYVRGEEVVTNNGHGVAPFFMAYNEIERMELVR